LYADPPAQVETTQRGSSLSWKQEHTGPEVELVPNLPTPTEATPDPNITTSQDLQEEMSWELTKML
jgi:hypothetical protein